MSEQPEPTAFPRQQVLILRLETPGRGYDADDPVELDGPLELAAYAHYLDEPEPGRELDRQYFADGHVAHAYLLEVLRRQNQKGGES